MYYGARYYDRTVGTFISPDTFVPDPTNLWDYNRFAYARLNPLKYNDPTGHCGVEVGVEVLIASDPDQCVGSAVPQLGEAAGQVAVVAATGYLVHRTAQNLNQDHEGYVTPDTGPAGSTVHADPLPVTSSASTSFPLADDGPQTSIPPSTGVYNDTLNILADPLPGVEVGNNIVIANTQGHHPWPQYLGGPKNQPLLDLPTDLHGKFHAGLDKLYPRARGRVDWNSLTRAEQEDVLTAVLAYSQDFDADYGMSTYDAVSKVLENLGVKPPP
jgi:hypothetical protein